MAELKVEHADLTIPQVELHNKTVLKGDPAILFALLADNYPWGKPGLLKICLARAFFTGQSLKNKDLPSLVESLKRSLPTGELIVSEGVARDRASLSLYINPTVQSFYQNNPWKVIPDSEPIKIVEAETEEEKREKLAKESLARVAYFFDPEAIEAVSQNKFLLKRVPEKVDELIASGKPNLYLGNLKFTLERSPNLAICWEPSSQKLVEAALALYLGEEIRKKCQPMEVPLHQGRLDLPTFRQAFVVAVDVLDEYTKRRYRHHPGAEPMRIGRLAWAMLLDLREKLPPPAKIIPAEVVSSDLPLAAAS